MRNSADPAGRSTSIRPGYTTIAAALGVLAGAQSASAIEIDTGKSDWKVRWDNTVKYSLAGRVTSPLPSLANTLPVTANQDDGDTNFKRGIVSNRLDLLSELDAGPSYGAHLSAAALV